MDAAPPWPSVVVLCYMLSSASALAVAPTPLVSAEWLRRNLANVNVYDVTQSLDRKTYTVEPATADFERAHIPSATFVDVPARLSDTTQRSASGALLHNMCPDADAFALELRRIGMLDADDQPTAAPIVLYSSGHVMWATRVWWLLHSFGLGPCVCVLDGGLAAWRQAGGEVAQCMQREQCMQGEVAQSEATRSNQKQSEAGGEVAQAADETRGSDATATASTARTFRSGALVDAAHVQRAVAERSAAAASSTSTAASASATSATSVTSAASASPPLLIDTLKPKSFNGRQPSRYGRGGHISTAVNLPYTEMLEGATFRAADQIRAAVEAAGVVLGAAPATVIAY